MHKACYNGHTATAEMLIEKGADVEAKDKVSDKAKRMQWGDGDGH